jgi:low density lipoprotein receptor adapter protein 1
VSLAVSPNGIDVVDSLTGERVLQVSIYQISFCSADATHNHVFAFIASDNEPKMDSSNGQKGFFQPSETDENLVCHAFLCQKRKMAQTVTLSVARSFERAYQIWQNRQFQQERKQKMAAQNKENIPEDNRDDDDTGKSLLIDLDSDAVTLDLCHQDAREYLQNTWVRSTGITFS